MNVLAADECTSAFARTPAVRYHVRAPVSRFARARSVPGGGVWQPPRHVRYPTASRSSCERRRYSRRIAASALLSE